MEKIIRKKQTLIIASVLASIIAAASIHAAEAAVEFQPMVVEQFFEEAKKNKNWKTAFATGMHEQIVFMNISPATNPNNEIGTEVHPFDQVILIVEGKGKAVINDQTSLVKQGDMIFVPLGTSHNVINLDKKRELKLISFYSATDIPKGAVYKKKADQTED